MRDNRFDGQHEQYCGAQNSYRAHEQHHPDL
jgi:hypothetical protein